MFRQMVSLSTTDTGEKGHSPIFDSGLLCFGICEYRAILSISHSQAYLALSISYLGSLSSTRFLEVRNPSHYRTNTPLNFNNAHRSSIPSPYPEIRPPGNSSRRSLDTVFQSDFDRVCCEYHSSNMDSVRDRKSLS